MSVKEFPLDTVQEDLGETFYQIQTKTYKLRGRKGQKPKSDIILYAHYINIRKKENIQFEPMRLEKSFLYDQKPLEGDKKNLIKLNTSFSARELYSQGRAAPQGKRALL